MPSISKARLEEFVRAVWCRRKHPWRGWSMTPAEVEMWLWHSASFQTGSWSRKPCRFCRGHDDEMPKVADLRERERVLNTNAQKALRINARIGRAAQVLAPGYGSCFRCKTPWLFVEGHSTEYRDGRGCFPLCEACWNELTPDERLPHYRALVFGLWDDQSDWPAIEQAVMEGR